mgnify:CR=1
MQLLNLCSGLDSSLMDRLNFPTIKFFKIFNKITKMQKISNKPKKIQFFGEY